MFLKRLIWKICVCQMYSVRCYLIMIINQFSMCFFKVLAQRMALQKRTKISEGNLRNRCSSTQAKPLLPGGSVSCQIASMKCQRHSRSFSLSQWWQLLNFQSSLLWRSWTLMMVSNNFNAKCLILFKMSAFNNLIQNMDVVSFIILCIYKYVPSETV